MSQALIHLHVERFADMAPARQEALVRHICPADLSTMARHPDSRQRQMLVWGLLRELLAEAANCAPTALDFARNEQGKPFLQNAAIHFNISHSQAACALAWSPNPVHLGVDIEDIGRQRRAELLAERSFSPGEIQSWQNADSSSQQWLRIWTRKEAILKATGLGIRMDLFSVDTENGEPPGHFTHPRLGSLHYRSWVASEQVCSLAWVPLPGVEVEVSVSGSLL
jgi:4'-phosphopantetheinyl transferase